MAKLDSSWTVRSQVSELVREISEQIFCEPLVRTYGRFPCQGFGHRPCFPAEAQAGAGHKK